ncbi:MAG: phage tail assembly protein [Phenylobacterium sp.]|nr:phage tail assembly protein [Phenylobacterium sp.]
MDGKPLVSDPITLEKPITRGEQSIEKIQIRKPQSGELRGVSLVDLGQMEVTALHKVLPRVTLPPLTEHEVSQLDPADLLELGAEVAYFLLKKARREAFLAG